MRRRTPWSEKERDRKVDSSIPGKFLAEYTVNISEKIDLIYAAPWLAIVLAHGRCLHLSLSPSSYVVIWNKENCSRKRPSNLTDRSPNTKKPPSICSKCKQILLGIWKTDRLPLLFTSLSLYIEDTVCPDNALWLSTTCGWSSTAGYAKVANIK